MSDRTQPIVCIGEAIVDLVCERNLPPGESPENFVPYAGGALANVAVAAARAGVDAALIGGVGDDRWGGWITGELAAAGVSLCSTEAIHSVDTLARSSSAVSQ